jgi:epoxyqueuosine reductase QueG
MLCPHANRHRNRVRFLAGTVTCSTTVPYYIVRNVLSERWTGFPWSSAKNLKAKALLRSDRNVGPTEFDVKTGRYRNIVSAKHCAVAAGLGRIGKNTLLVTPQFGNMVWLSAILSDLALDPDPILEGSPCPENCRLCVDVCPVHAIGEPELKQTDCSHYAFGGENGGEYKIKCNKCRVLCRTALVRKTAALPI